jgi:hypothetical protein
MRARSLATVSATIVLLAAAALRCSVPPLPPGPEAIPTSQRLVAGAVVAVPAGATIDRAALIASLQEMKLSAVIIQASADASGESVADRVSLAVQLQGALGGNVLVGGYDAPALNGRSMDALLQTDASFTSCYPGGPALDASASTIDKLRICQQAVSQKVADELARVGASPRIGCYVTHQPELTDTLSDTAKAKLHDFFADASSACVKANRVIGVAPVLPAQLGNPSRAADLMRGAIDGSHISLIVLEDGVARSLPTATRRASAYYDALRVAPGDGSLVTVWANVEGFRCAGDAGCDQTHPTDRVRFDDQVCGARGRVDSIIAYEYVHDLAGKPVFTGDLDAATDASPEASAAAEGLRAIVDDVDAAAQLRAGYLAWVDAGASCVAAAADEADAAAQADARDAQADADAAH